MRTPGRQRAPVERQRASSASFSCASTVRGCPVERLRDPGLLRARGRTRTAARRRPRGAAPGSRRGRRRPWRVLLAEVGRVLAVLGGDVDLLEAELLALVEVRRARAAPASRGSPRGPGPARPRRRRTGSRAGSRRGWRGPRSAARARRSARRGCR